MMGDALEFLVEGAIIQLHKFNGNPIGLQLPEKVELTVSYTEPGARGDTSGNVTKLARPGNRPGDQGSALHSGGRKGEGLHGNEGVCGARISRCMVQLRRKAQSSEAQSLVQCLPLFRPWNA